MVIDDRKGQGSCLDNHVLMGWVMLVGMGVANRRIPCPDCNVDGWPICCDCGKRMRYNVPRLGPSGGYVHADTGRFSCDHQEERPA